jgi:hypothetical protein
MGLKQWMGGIRGKLIGIFVVIKVVPCCCWQCWPGAWPSG